MQKEVHYRHQIALNILGNLVYLYFHIALHFKRNHKKINNDKPILVLANHQTDFDPIILCSSFKKYVYFLVTDSIYSNKIGGAIIRFFFNPIPKKKGFSDPGAIKKILKVVKQGGSVGIFPEGNRSYGEFQYPIDDSIVKLIKVLKIPVYLYNFNGGFGVYPRFSNHKRNGEFTGNVKRILQPEEYLNMDNESLLKLIQDELRVYDSDSNKEYEDNKRAEYLERMFFVCPICNKTQTLISKNEYISCTNCGLEVEYTKDLHLKSFNDNFKFHRLIDWYNYQKQYLINQEYKDDDIIFSDDNVKIFSSNLGEKRRLLTKGRLTLTTKSLNFNNKVNINISDIVISSPISGRKFNLSTEKDTYLIVGDQRFNPLKYVLIFNKLETIQKQKHIDKYYTLD